MRSHFLKSLSLIGSLGLTLAGVTGCAVAPDDPGAAPPRGEAGLLAGALSAGAGSSASCHRFDANEKNDKPGDATALSYGGVVDYPSYHWDPVNHEVIEVTDFEAWISWTDAAMCKHDEDWLLVPTAALASQYGKDALYLHLRTRVDGGSSCAASSYPEDWDPSWGETPYDPPAGPEHTLIAEVYDASTMALVGAETSDISRIWLDLGGAQLAHDVLLRLRGPKEADFDYDVKVTIQSDAYLSDECEF